MRTSGGQAARGVSAPFRGEMPGLQPSSEAENKLRQVQAWKTSSGNELFASWRSVLDSDSFSAFDQAVDRRGTLAAQNPENWWRFMHADVDSPAMLREEQWLVRDCVPAERATASECDARPPQAATYHYPQAALLGVAAGGLLAAVRYRHRPTTALLGGAAAVLGACTAPCPRCARQAHAPPPTSQWARRRRL